MMERGRRSQSAWANTLAPGQLVLLPLALLPGISWLPAYGTLAGAAVLLIVLLLWVRTVRRAPDGSRDVALLVSPLPGRSIGAWELALLAIVVAAVAMYVVVAWDINYITYNDGAYYYGVARHIALSGRFEEPIVWHFLYLPERIVHAPFDYWGCMTSLLLVPPLALFGVTLHTAILTMAAISAASLFAFWYLVCVALPLRYCATQLLAVLIYAFSPAMDRYRFQPESIAVVQMFLLFALIAFSRRRFVWSLVWGFCIFLTRGDGLVLFALIALAATLQQWRTGARNAALVLVLLTLAFAATYVLWSMVSFGTLTPPGQALVPRLPVYWRVLDYVTPEQRPWSSLLGRFNPRYIIDRLVLAVDTLRTTRFAPAMSLWLILAAAPIFQRDRVRTPGHRLLWLLCLGYFVVAWVSGVGFAPVRAPFTFAPLVVLAGAVGIDTILGWLQAWLERGAFLRGRVVAAGAAVLALGSVLLVQLPMLQSFLGATSMPFQATLAGLDDVLRGGAVASNASWYIIAYSSSPTVSIPHNGEAALEAVLSRYQVEWLVIFRVPQSGGRTRPLLNAILDNQRDRVGRFRLERVPAPGVKAEIFRVRPAP